MFGTLRRVKALVLGTVSTEDLHAQLVASNVPVTDVDCRTCANPCDQGHEDFRFDVDRESNMMGSVRPYRRQIVISTGKSDWEREVTDTHGSLAAYMSQVQSHTLNGGTVHVQPKLHQMPGLFNSTDGTKLSILNGSHHTLSDRQDLETVLIFPDYKLVADVPRDFEGAKLLWDNCIHPDVGRGRIPDKNPLTEKSSLSSWVIPYSCVILLCSHKRRDNRCHLAAKRLEDAFSRILESRDWTVHTQVEHPNDTFGLPLEEFQGNEAEKESHVRRQLESLSAERRVLILKNSHIGGHKFAGNCIIYTPQGSGIWLGRITEHDVEAIVTNTLEEGLIMPSLLRGGVNLSRPHCKTLNDW
ncbi:Sucrase/ferredoxin-like-domain-containing protein [Mycena floridula]|nr:Sucrase/ferredoxin-like-domain-containing protein [Mycena floridula]